MRNDSNQKLIDGMQTIGLLVEIFVEGQIFVVPVYDTTKRQLK